MRERMSARFLEAIAAESATYQERAMVARTVVLVGANYGEGFLAKSNEQGLLFARTEEERQAWEFGFAWREPKEA